MNYASIRTCDIANGDGVRVSLFVSGCTHRCKGCFNEAAQAFDYGEPFTREVEDRLLEALRPSFITGLTLLGGEPMEPANQRALLPFLRRFRAEFGETKTLWIYTGCVLEELKSGKVEEWKSGKVEEWKSGKVEEWKSGTVEEWKSGTVEELNQHSSWRTEVTDEILRLTDVLVDGPFVEELKDISLAFRGSSNQRILRLKELAEDRR